MNIFHTFDKRRKILESNNCFVRQVARTSDENLVAAGIQHINEFTKIDFKLTFESSNIKNKQPVN